MSSCAFMFTHLLLYRILQHCDVLPVSIDFCFKTWCQRFNVWSLSDCRSWEWGWQCIRHVWYQHSDQRRKNARITASGLRWANMFGSTAERSVTMADNMKLHPFRWKPWLVQWSGKENEGCFIPSLHRSAPPSAAKVTQRFGLAEDQKLFQTQINSWH